MRQKGTLSSQFNGLGFEAHHSAIVLDDYADEHTPNNCQVPETNRTSYLAASGHGALGFDDDAGGFALSNRLSFEVKAVMHEPDVVAEEKREEDSTCHRKLDAVKVEAVRRESDIVA